MRVTARVSPFACLFVCLTFGCITPKIIKWFRLNFVRSWVWPKEKTGQIFVAKPESFGFRSDSKDSLVLPWETGRKLTICSIFQQVMIGLWWNFRRGEKWPKFNHSNFGGDPVEDADQGFLNPDLERTRTTCIEAVVFARWQNGSRQRFMIF